MHYTLLYCNVLHCTALICTTRWRKRVCSEISSDVAPVLDIGPKTHKYQITEKQERLRTDSFDATTLIEKIHLFSKISATFELI